MKIQLKPNKYDIFVIAFTVCLIIISIILSFVNSKSDANIVVIRYDNEIVHKMNLEVDETFTMKKEDYELLLGDLTIQVKNGKVAVLGVSYKGNTGDDRESPAYEIIAKLNDDYEISIHDPHLKNPDFVSLDEATKDADLILILCDHNEFKHLDYDFICKNMNNPVIFDTKNIIKEVPSEIKLFNYGNLFKLN